MNLPTKVIALLSASLLLTSTALTQRAPSGGRMATATKRAAKTALLILLENGGVAANFAECKVGARKVRIPRIPVATCGRLCFALNPGENVAQMMRAARIIGRNRACTNPANWRVKTVTFDQWFKLASDYMLEEFTKSIARLQRTRTKYAKVEVLEDAALVPRTALARMRQLARAGYTLDVHVLTHGGNGAFYGGNGARFDEKSFFSLARGIPRLKLRSVYQMNCVSGTLIDDWTKLGAKVVNGTFGTKNNYMPQSYFHFTAKWLNGATFNAAVMGAYQESRIYTEPVYKLAGLGQYVLDSRHRVVGAGNCRLTAPAKTNDTAARVVKKTTAMICAGYLAAKKTAEQACALMIRAGCNINEVALELQRQYRCRTNQIAKFLRRARCSTAQVALCLSKTLKCSARQVAKHLRYAGCSTNVIARCLKEQLKCSTKNIAKYLRAAGCSANAIAKCLKQQLKCSTKNIAKYMRAAGCSFNQTAKAIWACSAKTAQSLQSLANGLVNAFQQNIAQVMANLAKLHIKC